MRFARFSSIAGLAIFLALFSAAAFGQDYRARIQGTVTDSSAASAAGAKVTLLNTKTGAEAVRQSSETGHYLFDMVEPGTYSISVELAGSRIKPCEVPKRVNRAERNPRRLRQAASGP